MPKLAKTKESNIDLDELKKILVSNNLNREVEDTKLLVREAFEKVCLTYGAEWISSAIDKTSKKYNQLLEFEEHRIYGTAGFMHKLLRLAEFSDFLDAINGHKSIIKKLKTNNETMGAFFELIVATAFQRSGFSVGLNKKSGIKGQDYDLVVSKNDQELAVEVKSKSPAIKYGRHKLRTTIWKASQQLPANKAGIIVVCIPAEWAEKKGVVKDFEAACTNVFRTNESLLAVVVIWHGYFGNRDLGFIVCEIYSVIANPSARFTIENLTEVLDLMAKPGKWGRRD